MTEADILRQFVDGYDKSSFRTVPYNNLVMNSKDDIRDTIISLVANKILKTSVDDTTMEIVLSVRNTSKVRSIFKIQELSDKLNVSKLKFRVLNNKRELPCAEGKKYEDREWERYVREVYLTESPDGKLAVLDDEGNPLFNEWFDNVCLVTFQSHPCYPEHTKYGVVVKKGHKYALVKEKGADHPRLTKNLNCLLKHGNAELTNLDYGQFRFYYDKNSASKDEVIYQAFWGYERTWAIPAKKLMVQYDKNLSYHEDIMINSDLSMAEAIRFHHGDESEYVPRYIYYKGQRKFFTYTEKEFELFIEKYEKDKKAGNLKKYNEHYEI